MLPDFGVGIRGFLFEPLDEYSAQKLRAKILTQMAKYEPGLQVQSLQLIPMSNSITNQVLVKMIVLDVMSYNEKFEFGHRVVV